MAGLAIKAEEIRGITVYGLPQVDYTLDGLSHQNFDEVAASVSLHQATIVEQQTGAVYSAIRLRQRAASDLGQTLAKLSGLLCRYPSKNPQSTDLPNPEIKKDSAEAKELKELADRLSDYGYNLVYEIIGPKDPTCCHGGKDGYIKITRGTCMKAQTRVQELVDLENNNIQQEMATLKGFVSKRDKAYSNCERVVKKYQDTAVTIIRKMAE